MTKADFYIIDGDNIEWMGSLTNSGEPENFPLEILIQVNRIMFVEMLYEYLEKNDGEMVEWPWMWSDSRMTDYSYLFHTGMGKVLMSVQGGRLVDPIKIRQGMDLIGADVGMGKIDFPIMRAQSINKTREILNLYGQQSSKII